MVAEKMRVHILAKELNVPSKVIVEKCKAEGIDSVKNHMSTLSAGLHATIREWFSEGSHNNTVETSSRVNLEAVRIKRRKPARTAVSQKTETGKAPAGKRMKQTTASLPTAPPSPSQPATETEILEPSVTTTTAVAEAPLRDELTTLPEESHPSTLEEVLEAPPPQTPPAKPEEDVEPEQDSPTSVASEPVEAPTEAREPDAPEPTSTPVAITPAGPQNIPAKAKLQGPRVVRYESPDLDVRPVNRAPREGRRDAGPVGPGGTPRPSPAPSEAPTEKGGRRRTGRLSPRRGSGRVAEVADQPGKWRDRDLQERKERLAGATGRRIHRRRAVQGGAGRTQPSVMGPKTQATVHEPVQMKEFCSATGLNFMQCFKVLKAEHDIVANVNMVLSNETAELLALGHGIELTIIAAKTLLDELEEEFSKREHPHLQPRCPVVTMLGHVDHGKTSLLDAIRATRVAAGEDGGITQHIGAYHIQIDRGAVTFLDTPGHEAFTAMRARGASLTDVVVLVVAADDGVMPQTVEAINHAKSADVPIVVALNKIDLGEQNKIKIFGQLAEHDLTPSGEWGGDIDVIPTSATAGVGITELVEHLADLSSLLDLKADPTVPATGTVIEAETKPGVGAVIRLLIREGTLHVGDFVVCGPAFGKVRALLDDRGQRIQELGPSMPVEVWGLDGVPSSGDHLYVLQTLQRAKDVACEMKRARIESARIQSPKVKTLEEMFLQRDLQEVSELNLIIKADVDGSIAALRQMLGVPFSDEVKLTIRHAGVGTVTDSDILLAAACHGIVVAYRVEPASGVRRLAERHGVDIRSYRVIYDVCDDIKKALGGLLAPEERMEPRATAEVRQLFRLSKKGGLVAGSYVTTGTLDRKHFAKIVRDGVVMRERCRFASLRRFKEDAREVRAGLECGIRFEDFDDIHAGDIIESYEIVKVARTL